MLIDLAFIRGWLKCTFIYPAGFGTIGWCLCHVCFCWKHKIGIFNSKTYWSPWLFDLRWKQIFPWSTKTANWYRLLIMKIIDIPFSSIWIALGEQRLFVYDITAQLNDKFYIICTEHHFYSPLVRNIRTKTQFRLPHTKFFYTNDHYCLYLFYSVCFQQFWAHRVVCRTWALLTLIDQLLSLLRSQQIKYGLYFVEWMISFMLP